MILLHSLWAAVRPEDEREAVLIIGLILLASGLALTPLPWLALAVPGTVLTLAGLAAYMRPRGEQ